MNSVPLVVILVAVLVADCLDACVTVRVSARSSLSESDLDDVGDVFVGDQKSLCVGLCGEGCKLSGYCEMTTGGIAFSRSGIVEGERECTPLNGCGARETRKRNTSILRKSNICIVICQHAAFWAQQTFERKEQVAPERMN